MEEVKNYEFLPNDFELVQANSQIKDQKFKTKATTFFKDAFRRFRKNKASVVGGIILGIIILLAIIVPIISPYDIENVSTPQKFLAPKFFESGFGFWDGTRKYTHIIYDTEAECPADFNPAGVSNIKLYPVSYIDSAHKNGKGGVLMFASDAKKDKLYYLESSGAQMDTTHGYSVTIDFDSEENVLESHLTKYKLVLYCIDVNDEDVEIVLSDWSNTYGTRTFDLSNALEEAGIDSADCKLRFYIEGNEDKFEYILIKQVVFNCAEGASNYKLVTEQLGFTEPNTMVLNADSQSSSYWTCTGRKGMHNLEVIYCDFKFDSYEAVYGRIDNKIYAISEVDSFVKNGLCTFEYNKSTGTWKFESLSEDCPIVEITSVVLNETTGKIKSVYCVSYKYYSFGYTSMPKFLLGTDVKGQDIIKSAFAGLRTSLILGVCTFVVCFLFGLLWGSISGYFGGSVDLIMERFCEILSGIPWIVIMTLAILHFGNNFLTFFLALCLTDWMGTAGLARTQFYRFKGREYVLASRTLGSSDMRLIFKHILPNSMGTIITSSVLMIPSVIFSEASLAYLNLGLKGLHSFGVLMSDNQQYLDLFPNLVIFPAIIMALMMISFNLFGNGLRDAFNPSLKGSE